MYGEVSGRLVLPRGESATDASVLSEIPGARDRENVAKSVRGTGATSNAFSCCGCATQWMGPLMHTVDHKGVTSFAVTGSLSA